MSSYHYTVVARASTGTTPPTTSATPLRTDTRGSEEVRLYAASEVSPSEFAGWSTRLVEERRGFPLPDSPITESALSTYSKKTVDTREYQRAVFSFTDQAKTELLTAPTGGFREAGVSVSSGGSLSSPSGDLPETNNWLFFASYIAQTADAQTLLSTTDGAIDLALPWRAADLDKVRAVLPNKGGTPSLGSFGSVSVGDRINVVFGQNGSNLYLYLQKNSDAVVEIINNNNNSQGTSLTDFSARALRFLTDSSDTRPFVSDNYRSMFHAGDAAPDGSLSGVRGNLFRSDGSLVSPAVYRDLYGQPQRDIYAQPSVYQAGQQLGTGQDFSVTGLFDGAAPIAIAASKRFAFNPGGLSGGRGAAALLNQAKQADGGWFFGGNGSSRVENFPNNIDANGYPTSFPTGYSTVFLKWDWSERPDVDFGAWKADWSGNLNGATVDVSGVAGSETINADNAAWTLTNTSDGVWSFVFRNNIPDTAVFESLRIYPTAHADVPDWYDRLDAGENWNPEFYRVATDSGCAWLRLMDMQAINNCPYATYASYPGVNASTWTDGVPISVLADLVVRCKADVSQWQIPHAWSVADCQTFGAAVRAALPGRVVDIGYSNEVKWNTVASFFDQREFAYYGTIVEFGTAITTVSRALNQTVISVPDATVFAVNELVAFGDASNVMTDDVAFYKITAKDDAADTITVEQVVSDSSSNGLQHAGSATMYHRSGLTGSASNAVDHWYTKRTYYTTKAFRDGWVSAGGTEASCNPVLEAQASNVDLGRQRINPTIWAANDAGYVNPRTYFKKLEIAPYIGTGFDDLASAQAIIASSDADAVKYANMRDLLLTDTGNGLPNQKSWIEDYQGLLTEFSDSTFIVYVYEGGPGMLQKGTATAAEFSFYQGFQASSYFVEVLEQHLQDLISINGPHFPVFAFVSQSSAFGNYSALETLTDMSDASNAWWAWQSGLSARDIPDWSPEVAA